MSHSTPVVKTDGKNVNIFVLSHTVSHTQIFFSVIVRLRESLKKNPFWGTRFMRGFQVGHADVPPVMSAMHFSSEWVELIHRRENLLTDGGDKKTRSDSWNLNVVGEREGAAPVSAL